MPDPEKTKSRDAFKALKLIDGTYRHDMNYPRSKFKAIVIERQKYIV